MLCLGSNGLFEGRQNVLRDEAKTLKKDGICQSQETEVGGLFALGRGQPELHSKTVSKKKAKGGGQKVK